MDYKQEPKTSEGLQKFDIDQNLINRTQKEFLANVSHELRTPMNAILGMLELSLQEELTPILRDYLSTAKDSADSLLLLVNDILDFSRLEAGRFDLEPVPFNLRDLLDDAVKTLSLRASEKGLELACYVATNVPNGIVGDPIRLRQIVTNLVSNAIKFTEKGEVVVTVKPFSNTSSLGSQNESLVLEFVVSDTGVGIAREDQDRIFSPFTQADPSTTRSYTGTGLGLAICYELTNLMGGKFWLESEVGRGSQFHFTVKLAIDESLQKEAEDEKLNLTELKDLPVLVVDDNKTNRMILEEMLTNWSMSPTIVASADQALDHLSDVEKKQQQYPLVIVDALMPDTDGFMLLEEAKSNGLLESATILMLSSADRQVFKDRCDKVEISAYLEKPVSQSDLLDAIATALHGSIVDQTEFNAIQEANKNYRILVAEDTPANQKVIKAILTKRGHDCTIANNGREAVDFIMNEEFDAILMDVQMPTMDGFQATAAIREHQDQEDQHTPIIAMTAHAMRGDKEKCIKAGMDDYISKPIDSKKILQLIEEHASKNAQFASGGLKDDMLPQFTESEPKEQNGIYSKPSSVMNLKAALDRVGNDQEILKNMVEYFFEDYPGLLAKIRSNFDSNTGDELMRAAHSLKGLCSNFDAAEAVEVAQKVEDLAQSETLDEVEPQIKILESKIKVLAEELESWASSN